MKDKIKDASGRMAIIPIILLAVTLGMATPWMGSRVNITSNFLKKNPSDDYAFAIHEVNKKASGSNHLAYTFYFISDPHMGDVSAYQDYNLNGCHPDLNLNVGGTGDPNGSYPGNHLKSAVELVNWHYNSNYDKGVEQGEGVFCVIGGDLAVTAEKAELQHANRHLRGLNAPWIPVIGNHDTWPWADIDDSWQSDFYFQRVFADRFQEASGIFPNWQKQPIPSGVDSATTPATRCQNWAFDMGPTHHIGLDFSIRSLGGIWEPLATLHDNTNGTWSWFGNHLDNMGTNHERLIISAHHPLDFPIQIIPPFRGQFTNNDAQTIINEISAHESNTAYWFSGHEQNDYDDYWAVGPSTNDSVVEVHFNSGTDRGGFYVALVKVYSDYVCDFTCSPKTFAHGDPVTFTSTSHFYSGTPINMYYWDFGDGSGVAVLFQRSLDKLPENECIVGC